MPMLHDPNVRLQIEARLAALRPDSPRGWGSMTSDQMLWHMNQCLRFSLGEGPEQPKKLRLHLSIMRFLVLNMPWPKGAPTNPAFQAQTTHDFDAERTQCLSLIDRFVSRPLDEPWPEDPAWGKVTGRFASKLHAKHFDHHLRQFNA